MSTSSNYRRIFICFSMVFIVLFNIGCNNNSKCMEIQSVSDEYREASYIEFVESRHFANSPAFLCAPLSGNVYRNKILDKAMMITSFLEDTKRKNNGKYVKYTSAEILQYFDKILDDGFGDHFVLALSYLPKDDTYLLYIISNYRVNDGLKYSCIMINTGKIFWKDDIIENVSSIDAINWNLVDFLVVDTVNSNHNYNFPNKI